MRSVAGSAASIFLHRCGAFLRLIRAIGPYLQGREPGGFAGKGDIGDEFPLKHLARKQQLAIFVFVADRVGDQATVQGHREPGCEVAHLVGVGKEHQFGLLAGDKLLQGMYVCVRGIGFE